MADYYFQTAGELWAAVARWATQNLLSTPVSSSGFGVFGNTGTFPGTPASIQITSSLPSSPDTFWLQNAWAPPYSTVVGVFSQPGINEGIDCNFPDPASGNLDFNTVAGAIANQKWTWLTDMCNATYLGLLMGPFSFGASGNYQWVAFNIAYSVNEWIFTGYSDFNRAYQPGPPFAWPAQISPVFGKGPLVLPPANVIVNTGFPEDVDISINNQQAIYSVYGKTTTIIP